MIDRVPKLNVAGAQVKEWMKGRIIENSNYASEHGIDKPEFTDWTWPYEGILGENKMEDHRPWGYCEILSDMPDHKVKRIVVFPGKRLSLQSHQRRAEHWTVVSGNPVVIRDAEEISLKPGDSIDIPRGAKHRLANPGREAVVFIEVQTGDYFGEDDIERFEDDYGRAGTNV